MIHSCTSFGKLKEVVVGRELELDRRTADMTFKYFYKENLGQDIYEKPFDTYSVNYELLQKRIAELDGLAKTLQSLGVEVHRPDKVSKATQFKTPTFSSECTSASNVRDITLVYGDTIVETPTFVRNRYFENLALNRVFKRAFDNGNGGRWVKSPFTQLTERTLDLDDWHVKREFSRVDDRYEMAIDGAQFLRIGKDVIVNVSTYNHYLGYLWVKSLFPSSTFHMVSFADNHIDGELLCLRPGVFLLNPAFQHIKSMLPEKFQKWKFICPTKKCEDIDVHGMTDLDIRLASTRGMDINVLSIDEHTVVVNRRALGVIEALEENGFDVVPVQLDNGEIFAGGIHCSTLDLVRDDAMEDYCT